MPKAKTTLTIAVLFFMSTSGAAVAQEDLIKDCEYRVQNSEIIAGGPKCNISFGCLGRMESFYDGCISGGGDHEYCFKQAKGKTYCPPKVQCRSGKSEWEPRGDGMCYAEDKPPAPLPATTCAIDWWDAKKNRSEFREIPCPADQLKRITP